MVSKRNTNSQSRVTPMQHQLLDLHLGEKYSLSEMIRWTAAHGRWPCSPEELGMVRPLRSWRDITELTKFRDMVGANTIQIPLPVISYHSGNETCQKCPDSIKWNHESPAQFLPTLFWLSHMELFIREEVLTRFLLCVCSGVLRFALEETGHGGGISKGLQWEEGIWLQKEKQ